MSANVFELLTKWQLRDYGDPLENRLTAAFVAVGNRYPTLLPAFAALADVDCDRNAPAVFRMHPPALDSRGRYRGAVDAELRLPGAVIWWEAKVESGLSGDRQLRKYLACLPQASEQVLVLLAPGRRRREFATDLSGDDRLRFVAWERVLETIRCACGDAPTDHQAFLQEALDFFAMHDLEPTPTLNAEHVDVLRRAAGALAAADAVLASAADEIDAKYGAPINEYEYERRHRPSATGRSRGWGASAQLVWEFDPDTVCLWAGLRYDPTSPRYRTAEMRGWRARLSEQDGWHDEPNRRREWFLGVYEDLGAFLGGNAEQQGRRVAQWIDGIFERLIRTRP